MNDRKEYLDPGPWNYWVENPVGPLRLMELRDKLKEKK